MTSLRAAVAGRLELLPLALALGVTLFFRNPSVPGSIYLLGVAGGCALAMQAIGIVLIHRSNRIINFAQVSVGVLGSSLFVQLEQKRALLLAVRKVCGSGCIPDTRTVEDLSRFQGDSLRELAVGARQAGLDPSQIVIPREFLVDQLPRGIDFDQLSVQTAPEWMAQVNFWLSLVISLALVVLFSWLAYVLVIKRFDRAPKLVGTLLTVGLGQVLVLVPAYLLFFLGPDTEETKRFYPESIEWPFDLGFRWGNAGFTTSDVLMAGFLVLAVVGLTLFFTRTAMGVTLRAASENPDRAATLGIDVGRVTSRVWIFAGLLSGVASLLSATGATGGAGADSVRYLAAAVVAGFTSIPVAVIAAVALGAVDQAFRWGLGRPALVEGVALFVIVVALFVQRTRRGRTDTADAGWKAARELRPIPSELKDLEVVRRWRGTAKVFGAFIVLALPWFLSPSQTNLASVTVLYGIIGLSLLVLTGWAGQMSLGHFAFAAVGGWVTAVLPWPFPLDLVAGGVAGAAVAVVIGLPALRLRGLQLAVATLAFASATTAILLNPNHLGGPLPANLPRPSVFGLDLDDQRTFFYFCLVFLALATLAVVGMRRSRIARALIAARDNEPGAQNFGVNLLRARLTAFAISGFMASVAGGLFALSQYGVNTSAFSADQSIKVFLMVVIGGFGAVSGPLIGAAYTGIADILARSIAFFDLLATGIGTVAVLLLLPGGLVEGAYRIRDAWLRRIAERYRIEVPSLVADRKVTGRRARILPKTRRGGGTVFVPSRYRPDDQWAVERNQKDLIDV